MDPFQRIGQLATLFVEDDELIRDACALMFHHKKCPMTTAATAEEGLRLLDEYRFDVIVSDFQLPGMNGLELFQKIQKTHAGTVKVLVSGHVNAEKDFAEAAEALDLSFLPKPFNVLQLASVIAAQVNDQSDRAM